MYENSFGSFEWDIDKEKINIIKHGIDFATAARAFRDPQLKIYLDEKHSSYEQRMFACGKLNGRILTVRFVYRDKKIRILGAGYWRKGRKHYVKKNG